MKEGKMIGVEPMWHHVGGQVFCVIAEPRDPFSKVLEALPGKFARDSESGGERCLL